MAVKLVHEKPLPVQGLYAIVVRAGKDRDAVRAAVERFYHGWGVEVLSAGGVRDPYEIVERVREFSKNYAFTLYLAGREDSGTVPEIERLGEAGVAGILVRKKRVRNARLEEIYWYIEKARAKLRLRLGWSGSTHSLHVIDSRVTRVNGIVDDEPYGDIILAWGGWLRVMGVNVEDEDSYVLLERLAGGEHLVIDTNRVCGRLHIPDNGAAITKHVSCIPSSSIKKLVSENNGVIEYHEHVSMNILRKALESAEEALGSLDAIVVPWSGGKDSTTALALAKQIYKDIVAVYVDTGVDFPHTSRFVDEASTKLGIDVIKVYAPVRNELRSRGLPRHDNRWCTGLKLEALCKTLSKIGERLLVVTGDRDAESETRSRRPPLRLEVKECNGRIVKTVVVSPLKQWSTALLLAYIFSRNIPLNPLYEHGFYRLGCYVCPALRSWELRIMTRDAHVASQLLGRPYYWRFVRSRLLSQG